jgi:hypothetical protein
VYFSSDDEVAEIGKHIRFALLVEASEISLIAGWSMSDHSPIVYYNFVSTRCRRPFRNLLQCAEDLDGGFIGKDFEIVHLNLTYSQYLHGKGMRNRTSLPLMTVWT